MSSVPVFAPTGELGDIPAGRLAEAVKAGFQPAVHVKSSDGQDGVIPAHRTADAVKAGMKLVPIEDQPVQHPGFWAELGGDLKGMLAGAGQISKMVSGGPAAFMPTAANMAINDMQRSMEGRSKAYRVIAPVGESLGANVRGMEESAQQGDVGGVLGHAAAVPTAMATGEALGQLPLGRLAKAGGGALQGAAEKLPIVGPIAKGAIRGAVKSWRASAPDVEIPPSKVSTTPPESVSKSSQLQQAKALQNVPVQAQTATPVQTTPTPAVRDMSTVLPRLRQIAQQIQQTEAAAPANADLTPALQKSLQPRIQGKIMQVLRKEGADSTVGVERLMKEPQLQGYSREQVQSAIKGLRDSGKVWGHEARQAGEESPSIYGVALRKR